MRNLLAGPTLQCVAPPNLLTLMWELERQRSDAAAAVMNWSGGATMRGLMAKPLHLLHLRASLSTEPVEE